MPGVQHADIDHSGLTGVGFDNPMTTQDDLIIGGASGAPTRFAKGTDGQRLTVDPVTHHLIWSDPVEVTEIVDLPTAETDTSLVLAPDGVGGVEFRAETGGVGGGGAVGIPYIDSATNADRPAASPDAIDDEFEGPALDAKWTNVGPTTVDFGGSIMHIRGGSEFWQAFVPGAGVAFDIRASFPGPHFLDSVDGIRMFARNSSGTDICVFDVRNNGGVFRFNRDNPGGLAATNFTAGFFGGRVLNLRMTRDASNNWQTYFAFDDGDWMAPQSTASSSTTVGRVGIGILNTGGHTWKRWSIDWFRRFA